MSKRIGTAEIARIFTRKKGKIDEIVKMISDSLTFSSTKINSVKLIKSIIRNNIN